MEEGQPGSPKDFNRTGNPAIGTLSWQSFQERDPTGYRKLVTSVMRDDFTQERVDYYTQRFDTTDTFPRAIAFYCAEGISVLLDGHHKACAAARLGRQLPCITIFPFGGYFYAQARSSSTPVPDRAYFGPFTVSISQLPAKILPAKPWQQTIDTRPAPYSGNLIRDSKLPQEFVDAGRNYPTWYEFGITTVADIGKVTDDDLSLWLENPLKYSPQLRAALIYLRCHCDPQLKEVAMKCADSSDRWSKLREAAFNHLAALKGDSEVEQYFIGYFVDVETGYESDVLTDIANSFWS